jgi:hypothetical protein
MPSTAHKHAGRATCTVLLTAAHARLPSRPFLRELRDFQQHIKMFDETATELVKEYMRKHAEKLVTSAVDRMRTPGKGKDYTPVLEVGTWHCVHAMLCTACCVLPAVYVTGHGGRHMALWARCCVPLWDHPAACKTMPAFSVPYHSQYSSQLASQAAS